MARIYKGKELRILLGGKAIMHATSCSLSLTSSTDEVATKDTNGTIVSPGNVSGTLTSDSLIAQLETGEDATHVSSFDLIAAQYAKTEYTFEFKEFGAAGASGNKFLSGSCFVTGNDLTADVGSNSTASVSFSVTGDVSIETIA